MAAGVTTMSSFLVPSCSVSSRLISEESFKALDQRNISIAVLGLGTKQRPAAALGGRRAVDPTASGSQGILLSCSRSRFVGVSATKEKQKRSPILDLDVNDNVDEEDDDDQDDEATEFTDMEEWMKNKPAGFGLKEYDTSLEDRLLAEIKAQEAAAQAANATKKKTKKPVKTTEKQDAPPQGVEVYVGNLPRKRNVDRDLRGAFRSARGLLHIRPIVDGNEKTREPMCKGLAFLTFASDGEAKDFIQRYNDEEVQFGKMAKKVVCQLAASNSPFKKQVFQNQGPDSPRLQVRDRTPVSLSLPVAVDHERSRELSTAQSNVTDKSPIKRSDDTEGADEEVDSLDVAEEELRQLEHEIWANLEDEDDFELDRELEGDEEGLNFRDALDDNAHSQTGEDLGQVDIFISDVIHTSKAVDDVLVEDEDQEAGIQEAETSRGRGFGLKSGDAAGDKDKRIQELESKLKEMQIQLEKGLTKTQTQQSEENIEALEKRLLARSRSASEKGSRTSISKRVTGSQKPSLKVKNLPKQSPSRPKLGSASRLKQKERQIYTGVMSKYSSSEKEVAQ